MNICETCNHCFIDSSVNAYECLYDDITEEEIEKYFENGKDGCPYYEEEEYEDVDDYYESLNMPCDTYGMAACSHSCPRYYQCQE